MVPTICDDCGTIWGAQGVIGGAGGNITITGSKVGPCPKCGGWGSIPDGTYDLIDDTLQVVRSADLPAVTIQNLIELLEGREQGTVTDAEVVERIEAEAPALADTIKDYLKKSDPLSWLSLLFTMLTMMQSSPEPPTAEDIANAVWAKDHPGLVTPPSESGAAPRQGSAKPKKIRKRPPKTYGKDKTRPSKRRR